MKLISSPPSPFARKAKALLIETGQEDVEVVEVMSSPTAPNPELTAANPLSKIPALVRPDGCTLYDSRVVTRFLDARVQGELYPQTRLWEVLTLEATGDAIMDAGVLMVYENRCRPEDMQFGGWLDAQWGKIEGALDALNTRWMSHLAGPVDMGQIAVGCALGYLDFRHGDREWRKGRDALDDWFAVFSQRESFRATKPV
ncbi:glutathione S-transferase family protein [Aliiroseovarius crassostreae]|uniref:Glutathione S-transferase family protein n=1 Tax=Aliiroseovarius crassostreae TaxID=154981 RepID=A0A9Q9M0Z7_9RHOB|nr:glutathione S-transferase family protein [Aliiroseovarius crassostreae]UWP97024.1 glutathione S-transferase family protein [Aliiroseovarius crassostreae]